MTEIESFGLDQERAVYLARLLVVVALCVPLSLIMGSAFQLGLLEVLLAGLFGVPILLALAIAGITSLIWSVRSAMKKAWRRSLMTSILPIVLLLVALNPLGFLYACDHIGEVARFVALRSSYDRQVAALPANQRPGLVVFIWDGFLGASNGVLYDATDQVTLSPGQQSADWLARASHTELKASTGDESAGCGYSVRPLWDHYYLAGFWC
jgi:hypothetical protein